MSYHTKLADRGVIAVTGDDCDGFLQGIVTNDVFRVTDTRAGYGAVLTPQGKYLFDFFMIRNGDGLLLDTEKDRIDAFVKKLSMYKLRAKVDITDVSDRFQVCVTFGDSAPDDMKLEARTGTARPDNGGAVFVDPRLTDAGVRSVVKAAALNTNTAPEGNTSATAADYDLHRITLGLPDGSRDLIVEKSVLLENGFDELNGIDWNKGCYMGQEVTARMKHRGLVKKRLVPVSIDGPAPESGTSVTAADRVVGEMRSSASTAGLAMIKLDNLNGDRILRTGDAVISPRKPAWANF